MSDSAFPRESTQLVNARWSEEKIKSTFPSKEEEVVWLVKVDWKQRSTDGGDVRAAEKRVGKRWIDEGGDKPGCRNPDIAWTYTPILHESLLCLPSLRWLTSIHHVRPFIPAIAIRKNHPPSYLNNFHLKPIGCNELQYPRLLHIPRADVFMLYLPPKRYYQS
ncbi:hypothetical protein KC331_g71 [Hortaea werneckii]|nr:hypothetical protein KC331_g71 [Hortaea werneckii]